MAMNTEHFGIMWDAFEGGEPVDFTRPDVLRFLDEVRRRRSTLSPRQWEGVNAIISSNPPDGHHKSIQSYGGGFRIVVRKQGTTLPAENGDSTP